MEYLLDTANLDEIRHGCEYYPVTGVTSNPSIIKAEGKIDLFAHFREIRRIIGDGRTLHMQTVAKDCAGILADADAILRNVDQKVYIKVPTTEEGLKAMRALKMRGVGVTATAVYSKAQGFLAIASGADFIAPYFNRMENLDIDARDTIAAFASMIARSGSPTKILAASFKNMAQVNDAFLSGAQTVTLAPSLLREALSAACIQKAVDDFSADWKRAFGSKTPAEL